MVLQTTSPYIAGNRLRLATSIVYKSKLSDVQLGISLRDPKSRALHLSLLTFPIWLSNGSYSQALPPPHLCRFRYGLEWMYSYVSQLSSCALVGHEIHDQPANEGTNCAQGVITSTDCGLAGSY